MKGNRFLRLLGILLVLISATPVQAATPLAAAGSSQAADSLPAVSVANEIEVQAESYGLPPSNDDIARLYEKTSVLLNQNDSVHFEVDIPQEGDYTISFDMASAKTFINPPEGQLQVDGTIPMEDAQRILFPVYYKDSQNTFPVDRYGNDALIRQEQLFRWSKVPMRDVNFSRKYPSQVHLTAGTHEFTFTVIKESMYLGSIYLAPFTGLPNYEQYLAMHPVADSSGVLIEKEAELPSFKNDTSIRPINTQSLEVTPYDTYRLLLNTLGGDSWKNSGTAVYYEFDVPSDGMYTLTLRVLQNYKNNFTVFRRVTINGEVPFDELNEVPFPSSTKWSNITLGANGIPYKIFLKKGTNVVGFEANDAPYRTAIEKIKKVLVDINVLSLEIKKLTGNQPDRYKEWVISDYIPDLKDRLLAIAADLQTDLDVLKTINRSGGSQEVLSYQMAIDNILFLAKDPNKIPSRMNRFSEGSGSAAQLLGDALPLLQGQPLAMDKITLHSPDMAIPEVSISPITSFVNGTERFLYSFRPNLYQSIGAGKDELEVWVNRPRQYVDLMQSMTDEIFTPQTGIKVKFSIMPDESKLILANAAGIQPDVALGVSTNIPYELAIRNALKDLRSFSDFDSYIRIYSPGALLSYIINDSVYAIPETQDFWVTFYRKDIMGSLGIPIPHTWNEVIQILPELQRQGMNFNTPLSAGSGLKPYLMTAPYLFNYGAKLYSDDGFETGLGSEQAIRAIRFMAESFTIYGMPLTTANFYDSFRYGSLPIGVSNFETYVKLMTAAPEIANLWDIDLYPATVLPDGTENRYATGSAQACIMFDKTKRPEDSWEFMKWWMSTETQVDFQQQLIMNYGMEYLWNSANLEAFQYLPIPEHHRQVILQQWQWLQEPVKLPGSYMQEREISNAWNKIVFDGVNPRVAIDESIIIINREISRKMEEFGYLQNGVKVKEYKVPTIETVKQWMGENGQ